ncbi:hypothetical protein P0136_05050 [Lentisphaerota bacterium ZTH]|nr:hypothetical protein JYG24_03835 [Lentisphaerota bacterium]WET07358.1 hypothetical protein P0136_05050 [Lentisphaerota bacterium ZTH]
MLNFYKIAKNTFIESIREPIFFLLLLTALVLIGNFPFMTMFVFFDQVKLVVDSSMATTLLFGLFAAVLSSSHTVSREMRNGTVLLLMSKPVTRLSFITAKMAGIMAAVILFVFICNSASFVSVYIAKDQFHLDMAVYYAFFTMLSIGAVIGMVSNYLYNKPFPSVATAGTAVMIPLLAIFCTVFRPAPELDMQSYLYAMLLLFFSVSTMAAITVVFATRLEVVANLTITSCIFFMGLISNYLFMRDTGSEILNSLLRVFYAILPNWQFFWLADALASKQSIPFSYVAWSFVYVILYIFFCAIWAVGIFKNKEIASDTR